MPCSGNTSIILLQINSSESLSVFVTRSVRPLWIENFDFFDADKIISAAPCAALIATSKMVRLSK